MRTFISGLVVVAAIAAAAAPSEAGFVSFGTFNLTDNNPDIGAQFRILMTDEAVNLNTLHPAAFANVATSQIAAAAVGQVNFLFLNLGPLASSITDIYIDDGSLFSLNSVFDGGQLGVDFSLGASPGNLPGGNIVDFDATASFTSDSNPPTQPNGANPGEWIGANFTLIGGQTFGDLLTAINIGQLSNATADDIAGGLRMGFHVQGLTGGGSDSYLNGPLPPGDPEDPPEVPEPSSIVLLALGALGLAAKKKFSVA